MLSRIRKAGVSFASLENEQIDNVALKNPKPWKCGILDPVINLHLIIDLFLNDTDSIPNCYVKEFTIFKNLCEFLRSTSTHRSFMNENVNDPRYLAMWYYMFLKISNNKFFTPLRHLHPAYVHTTHTKTLSIYLSGDLYDVYDTCVKKRRKAPANAFEKLSKCIGILQEHNLYEENDVIALTAAYDSFYSEDWYIRKTKDSPGITVVSF